MKMQKEFEDWYKKHHHGQIGSFDGECYASSYQHTMWVGWQAAKASVVPEWQPISTAPKDKHILIKSEDGIFEAIWEKGFFVPTFAPSHGCGCCGGEDAQPTHWMELPKEPSNDS